MQDILPLEFYIYITIQVASLSVLFIETHVVCSGAEGGGVLLYIGYISMCGSKVYGFSAVFVINKVMVLGTGHIGHK